MISVFAFLAVLAATACAPDASAHAVPPAPAVVAVDVYDRTDRVTLPVHGKDGRRYVIGAPGHEYAVRIRNLTGGRVLAVTSVDGINVVTGETASPRQSGYVLDAWECVEVDGWRKSLSQVAAFYFTDLRDSYAARIGRPYDVGVIGVAAFLEKPSRVGRRESATPLARDDRGQAAEAQAHEASAGSAVLASSPPAPRDPSGAARNDGADDLASSEPARPPVPRIGTGHGREETSLAQQVSFDRASSDPAQTVVVQYDRRENLVAMGVLPRPAIAWREPRAFPAPRFVPDPPR